VPDRRRPSRHGRGECHFPTIKPIDTAALHAHAENAAAIVSVEEHTIIGGLGGACAEYLAETDLLAARRFKRVGIPDVFPSVYGDQNGMMKKYGVSADAVATTAKALLAAARPKSVRVAA
jgi:transketolase